MKKAKLTKNAQQVFEKRYLHRDIEGNPTETIEEAFMRVAKHVASVEESQELQKEYTEKFYDLLTNLEFLPNSPTFMGAGRENGMLSACFVLPIEDDMGKLPEGIYQVLSKAILIQQAGGGTGFSFSRIRPRGALVNTTNGITSGPISFLKVYDTAIGETLQGGLRRGAGIAILRIDHPDIEEFIECKSTEGSIANFNISVALTDKFMQAVENNDNWDLVFPDVTHPEYSNFQGTLEDAEKAGIPIKVYKSVKAKGLFNKIVEYAHRNGEPGILFIDTINKDNPVPDLYTIEACNPCISGDALLLSKNGIVLVDDIEVGDVIWSGKQWTKVVRKVCSGTKDVYNYQTSGGNFLGTANHNVFENGIKRAISDCEYLDTCPLPKYNQYNKWLTKELEGSTIGLLPLFYKRYTDDPQKIENVIYLGKEPVYDITVNAPEHTYWTDGLLVANCGEQPLGPYENCCLGSINLAQHLGKDTSVDWIKLKQTVELGVRFLDNVIDANGYIPSVPEIEAAAKRTRKIGLGIMGLADLLYHCRIRYGSEEGIKFAKRVMEFIRYHAMDISILLAKKRGSFPEFENSIYYNHTINNINNKYWYGLIDYTLNWTNLYKSINCYGIRNACTLTIAPTGCTASVAGCEGYGCEPVFALAYTRTMLDNGKKVKLDYVSPIFERALQVDDLANNTKNKDAILKQVLETGTCQNIPEVPDYIKNVFVTASDISGEEHVKMQAALQEFVDAGISKTINFPSAATKEDVEEVFKLAWKLGCKGLTVYITGSRNEVVLETKKAEAVENKNEFKAECTNDRVRPDNLNGCTSLIKTPLGKSYVTINSDHQGPFEVFITTGKGGSEVLAIAEGFGRLISYILQLKSEENPMDRLKEIAYQLTGIGGSRSIGFGSNKVGSLPDGLGICLSNFIEGKMADETIKCYNKKEVLQHKSGDICPDCGEASYIRTEGCTKCALCGYSEC